MGALVTIYNDGPDSVQVRLGSRWLELKAGTSSRFNTTAPLEFEPMPKIDPDELALHMGKTPTSKPDEPPCRLVNDE